MPTFVLDSDVDLSIFETAKHTHGFTLHLPVDADTVWSGLTADEPLAWCTALHGSYTSPRPFGIGTTRSITVQNRVVLEERFFHWDDTARQHAFVTETSNVPFFGAFAENYRVTPTERGCDFTWQFAMQPRRGLGAALSAAQPLLRRQLFASLQNDTARHFRAD